MIVVIGYLTQTKPQNLHPRLCLKPFVLQMIRNYGYFSSPFFILTHNIQATSELVGLYLRLRSYREVSTGLNLTLLISKFKDLSSQ